MFISCLFLPLPPIPELCGILIICQVLGAAKLSGDKSPSLEVFSEGEDSDMH